MWIPKRIALLNGLTTVAIIFASVLAILWIWSGIRQEHFFYFDVAVDTNVSGSASSSIRVETHTTCNLNLRPGVFGFNRVKSIYTGPGYGSGFYPAHWKFEHDSRTTDMGLRYVLVPGVENFRFYWKRSGSPGHPFSQLLITCPIWPLFLFALLLPGSRLIRRMFQTVRSRRASHAGLCPKCGYDVRANPDRCSECGHAFQISVP